MLFEVMLPNGTSTIVAAHNKRTIQAIHDVPMASIIERKRCRGRNQENGARCQEVATVQSTFCATCWDVVLAEFRERLKDEPIPEQELEHLAMSFFVEG